MSSWQFKVAERSLNYFGNTPRGIFVYAGDCVAGLVASTGDYARRLSLISIFNAGHLSDQLALRDSVHNGKTTKVVEANTNQEREISTRATFTMYVTGSVRGIKGAFMSDFQTMDDFAVLHDYLTPDRLSVQAYSYASGPAGALFLWPLMITKWCRWHAVWLFRLHSRPSSPVMDLITAFLLTVIAWLWKYVYVSRALLLPKGWDGGCRFAWVLFLFSWCVLLMKRGKHLLYLCEDLSVTAEDWVCLTGSGNAEKEAFVERIS